jgi:hypothetical protein
MYATNITTPLIGMYANNVTSMSIGRHFIPNRFLDALPPSM